jgi:hypothetical protein
MTRPTLPANKPGLYARNETDHGGCCIQKLLLLEHIIIRIVLVAENILVLIIKRTKTDGVEWIEE